MKKRDCKEWRRKVRQYMAEERIEATPVLDMSKLEIKTITINHLDYLRSRPLLERLKAAWAIIFRRKA
jgi:hypothetical protein